jgi:hypothetical protein
MRYFENLGARIIENGALDEKIWALEAFRGKQSFQECSRGFLEFWSFQGQRDFFRSVLGFSKILEWLEGLGTITRGSSKV